MSIVLNDVTISLRLPIFPRHSTCLWENLVLQRYAAAFCSQVVCVTTIMVLFEDGDHHPHGLLRGGDSLKYLNESFKLIHPHI